MKRLPDLLSALPVPGYGLWMLLGAGLAANVRLDGRGEVLAPLSLGLLFVAAGLLLARLGRDATGRWQALLPPRDALPATTSMLAMGTFLPLLAVAGLVRGDNDFWATRLAGALLAVGSAATLAAACRSASLSAWAWRDTLAALFAGGLWLWCFLAAQQTGQAGVDHSRPWLLALLAAGVLTALLTPLPRRRGPALTGMAAACAIVLAALFVPMPAWGALVGALAASLAVGALLVREDRAA